MLPSVVLDDFGAVWVRVTIAKIGVMRGVRRAGVVIERSAAPTKLFERHLDDLRRQRAHQVVRMNADKKAAPPSVDVDQR